MSYQTQAQAIIDRQGSLVENDLIYLEITSYQQHQTMHPGAKPAATYHVVLEGRVEAFHKPFVNSNVPLADFYGHHRLEPSIHECVAWRLAHALGAPLDDIVAPTVMRDHEGNWGSLSLRQAGYGGSTIDPQVGNPSQSLAAAFFDSLIGQQDRHAGNLRWDAATTHLGLFDHGYCFANPGDLFNQSMFVRWRWDIGQEALQSWEVAALRDLLDSHDHLGMADFLRPGRLRNLLARAALILSAGVILGEGVWG
jgi:hypothetical protein